MSDKHADKAIGLALGGGAILGAAHVGVLQAIEKANIRLKAVSGTSIGAFIAALYAFGVEAKKIEEIVLDLDWLDVTSLSLSKFGLLSNKKLGKSFTDAVGDVSFDEAKISLAVVATDIGNGKKMILTEGNVAKAVMASSSVPGIFNPVEIDECMLVDGGLVENVPLSPLRDLNADYLIGVDLNDKRKVRKPDDVIDVLTNSLDIAIDNATELQTEEADLLITPELTAYSRTDAKKTGALIKEGLEAATDALAELT